MSATKNKTKTKGCKRIEEGGEEVTDALSFSLSGFFGMDSVSMKDVSVFFSRDEECTTKQKAHTIND